MSRPARWMWIFLALLPALLVGAGKEPRPPLKIFVLHSYPLGITWTDGTLRGLSTWLTKRDIPHTFKEYEYENFAEQFTSPVQQRKEAVRIAKAITDFDPDYVLVCDDEAANAYLQGLYALRRKIVFTGMNRTEAEVPGMARNRDLITGVFERYPITQSLKLLRDLTKNTVQSISLITSKNESSLAIVQQFETHFARNGAVKLRKVYVTSSWQEWQDAVKEINRTADALWMLVPFFVTDAKGASVELKTMGKWLAENIKVPSLSIVDVSLHLGVMASISVTPEDLGEAAGRLITQSWEGGVAMAKIPPTYLERGKMMINIDQTDQIGIVVPIEILEYATVVRNRPSGGAP